MRKIIAAMQMSLDGLIEGPNGEVDWIENWEDSYDLMAQVDTCVLGGGMYPGYEQYWTAILADPQAPFEPQPGVVFDFCISRAARHPAAFLKGWSGTLVWDDYVAYDPVIKLEQRIEAGCAAHARRKFDELIKANQSPVAAQAVQRIEIGRAHV